MTVDSGHDFDVVVIGGGTAGMTAAREIARGGKHVALVEQRRTGGECLHTGCVPSKTFLATAKLLYRIGHAGDLAVDVPQAHVDFDRLKQRKDAVIDRVGAIDTAEALESDGVRVFSGTAKFTGSFSLDTGSQVLTARQFVLATGSRPAIPPIEGLHSAGYLTHESILDI
ncbi:MAG: FAD-dependent oxidoreductase, partial [Thermomicrobiales bacterium]